MNTKTHDLLKDPGVFFPESLISVRFLKRIEGPTPAVQFVVVISVNHKPVFSIPGWRVWKGQIFPPARKVGKTFYPVFTIEDPSFLESITYLMKFHEKDYKDVRFPEVKEENIEEPPGIIEDQEGYQEPVHL